MKRYDCTDGGVQHCYGCYTMAENELGDYVRFDDIDALLREALSAMINMAPRVKEYDGCFGRMAGGVGGEDCECTTCKIRRELG